jgi:Tol biopolymer transport system component/DNA-binding winged helix-turn-helix (wHTH) protein
MLASKTSVFRFADVEVREREFCLVKAGEVVPVEPKAFRVLLFLLRNPLKLITKEELLDAVWGDTAVSENSLTRSIALLRRLLGDDTHVPRFIETVATVGYRFVCPIEVLEDANGGLAGAGRADTQAEPQSKEQRLREMRWIALGTAGVVLAGAAGLAWYALRPLPMIRITSYMHIASVGQSNWIAGTDGSSLYLRLSRPNGTGVVPVSGGRMTPLSIDLPTSKDSPNDSPEIVDVSPDGSKLLVGSNLVPALGRKLWIVDARGGGARYLAQSSSAIRSAIWSPDGRTVLYSTSHGDLYTIPSEGGEPRLLLASPAQPGAPLALHSLAWSPDGNRIRFARNSRYWEMSADGKNPHEILPNWHAANPKYFMCCGDWTPDGDYFSFLGGTMYFSQNLAAARQLWALDERRSWPHRANPEPVELTTGATIWNGTAFSRDGKNVYSSGMTPKGELVRYDAKSKQLVPYLGGISAEYVNFSRDGKYLLYVAFPDWTMWRANRDGSGLQQLTGPPFYPITPEWSPDGTQILFSTTGPSHPGEMYTISSQGGVPKRLLPDDKASDAIPDWSPDGKKIVFEQNPSGTGFGTYASKGRILDLNTGKVTDLPPCPKPCYSPRWSPDGRYILELAVDHKEMMLLDLRTNQWSQLDPKLGAINYPRWSRDGRSIYFQDADAGVFRSAAPGIYRVPVTGGRAEKVVDMKGFRGAGSLGIGWSDLDPDDTPLLLRDVSIYDIYALALERK